MLNIAIAKKEKQITESNNAFRKLTFNVTSSGVFMGCVWRLNVQSSGARDQMT